MNVSLDISKPFKYKHLKNKNQIGILYQPILHIFKKINIKIFYVC